MTDDSKDLSGDWGGKLTTSGELIVADAPASHKALVEAIESEPGPSDAAERKAVPAKTAKDVVPAGKRPDWNFNPDGTERQRDEKGRYVATATASKDAMIERWDKEQGSAQAIANIEAAETAIIGASANPEALRSHIATMPKDIALVASDYLRLPRAGFGRQDKRLSAFLDALTPAQFEQFRAWWEKINRTDQNVILSEIGEI